MLAMLFKTCIVCVFVLLYLAIFSAVTRPGGDPVNAVIPLRDERCFINYHLPSRHNNMLGSVGATWCSNCMGANEDDETNTIHARGWRPETRAALTNKLRTLTSDRRPPGQQGNNQGGRRPGADRRRDRGRGRGRN